MDYSGPGIEPTWVEELERIAPVSQNMTWLKLVWEAGDPWMIDDPDREGREISGSVHRWIVYQMHPLERTPEFFRTDLMGPSPRERGRYDRVLGTFVPDPSCNVTLTQWHLYRDTGAFGRPYWIVQGSKGGHKKRFNRVESVISRIHGGPKDPPLPGELPYATPNRLTFRALAQADRMRNLSWLLDRYQKDPARYFADDPEREGAVKEAVSDEVWKWLATQVADVVSDNSKQLAGLDLPYGDEKTIFGA